MALENLNLRYRINRLFQGESGIVERISSISLLDQNNYDSDYLGNQPMQVSFRNPLGELCTNITPIEKMTVLDQPNYDIEIYKQYKLGERFP